MLSAPVEKNVPNTNNFVSEKKCKLLKACADLAILAELSKQAVLSGPDIISLFKDKYGMQMSPGTIYPILCSMEKKRLIRPLPNRKKKVYALTTLGKEALYTFQVNLEEIQGFIVCLATK
jgi:DNA-binding PadR family transcriptional regulator